MFETKLAEDIRRKLSSINPNLKVEPLLLTKAYLSHRVKAKLHHFFPQEGEHGLRPFPSGLQ